MTRTAQAAERAYTREESITIELNELAHDEDSSRLTAFADNQSWGRFLELPPDVVRYNRCFGWYHDAGEAEKFGE